MKKWVNLAFLLCGIVAWVVVRQIAVALFDLVPIRARTDWIISLPDWTGIIAGFGVFIWFLRWQKVNLFLMEVFTELSKVTWPARKETMISTGVVAVMVAVAAMILFFFDFLWGTLVGLIYKQPGG